MIVDWESLEEIIEEKINDAECSTSTRRDVAESVVEELQYRGFRLLPAAVPLTVFELPGKWRRDSFVNSAMRACALDLETHLKASHPAELDTSEHEHD